MKSAIQKMLLLSLLLSAFTANGFAQGWTSLTPATSKTLRGVISVNTMMTIAVGDDGTVIGTTDGGTTWSTGNAATTEDLNKVFVFGLTLPVIAAVGDNGTMRYSTNVGVTWNNWIGGTAENLNDIFVHDPTTGGSITVVGDNGTIIYSNNNGALWNPRISGTTKHLNGVFFRDNDNGVVVGSDGVILRTTNAGVTWHSITSGTTADLNHVFFTTPNDGFAAGDGGLILNTTDGGQTWSTGSSSVTQDLYRLSFSDINNGWAVGALGTIIHTTDGGANWSAQWSGVTAPIYSVFFVDAMNGMAVGNSGLVLKTTNGGTPVELSSFSASTLSGGRVQLRWRTETESSNYGFEVQRRAGAEWEVRGFVAGHGDSRESRTYSFTDTDLPGDAVVRYRLRQIDFDGQYEYSPIVEAGGALPPSAELRAFPHPVRDAAVLTLRLPETVPARLRIVSSDGRHTATLLDDQASAGTHSLTWNAEAFPSGVYFLLLEAGDHSTTERILIQH